MKYCMIVLITIIAGSVFAQTEISGEVSGVWTSDDSPYIVVDSTWVAEGDTLVLDAGVHVEFQEGLGLDVWGRVFGNGTEQDSVYIRVADDVEDWRGLWFYGRNRTQWDYASIVCPDSIFVLANENSTLILNNCLVDAGYNVISGHHFYGAQNCIMTINNSTLRARTQIIIYGGRLTANHTLFDFSEDEGRTPGFSCQGPLTRFTSCVVIGGSLRNEYGTSIIDSCRFLRGPHNERVTAGPSGPQGRMTETYVEGGSGISFSNGATIPYINNTTLSVGVGNSSAHIEGCNIGERLLIDECEDVSILKTTIGGNLSIRSSDNVVVDSCLMMNSIPGSYIGHNREGYGRNPRFLITRSIIKVRVSFMTENSVIDHNTILFDSVGYAAIAESYGIYTNNIILNSERNGRLFSSYNPPQVFEYNYIYGFDILAGPDYDQIFIEEADSTNIIADPLLDFEELIPRLTINSPCIDSGDPDFELDPDGSRSDIGATFFDHRLSVFRPEVQPVIPQILSINTFPNPFNSSLNVSLLTLGGSQVHIKLFDLSGRIVSQTQLITLTGTGNATIDATTLSSGSYVLMVETGRYKRATTLFCLK